MGLSAIFLGLFLSCDDKVISAPRGGFSTTRRVPGRVLVVHARLYAVLFAAVVPFCQNTYNKKERRMTCGLRAGEAT